VLFVELGTGGKAKYITSCAHGRQIMEGTMALESTHQPATDEIRKAFIAMIDRLQEDVEKIPDELVGKAKLVQLKIFLAHSRDISDPDELLDFCLSALAMMKCSIDGARLGRQGRLIEKALKGLRAHDGVDLSSIMFEGLHRFGEANDCIKNVPSVQ
jgi:hypothetical protein